jgi:hypothetical protein
MLPGARQFYWPSENGLDSERQQFPIEDDVYEETAASLDDGINDNLRNAIGGTKRQHFHRRVM